MFGSNFQYSGSPNPNYAAPQRVKPQPELTGLSWWKALLTGNLPQNTSGVTGVRGSTPGAFKVLASLMPNLFGGTGGSAGGFKRAGVVLPGSLDINVPQPFYQVRDTDKNLSDVAERLNVPLQTIVDANGGARTLPPSGSYLQTYTPPSSVQEIIQRGQNVTAQPGSRFTAPNYSALAAANPYEPERTFTGPLSRPTAGGAAIRQADLVAAQFSNFQETFNITGKTDTSLLPQSMSLQTVRAMDRQGMFDAAKEQGLTTFQALETYGFSFQNGSFVLGAAPTEQAGAPKPGQAGYQPSGRPGGWQLVRSRNGKLIWQQPNRREQAPILMAEAANASSQPATTIALRQESG